MQLIVLEEKELNFIETHDTDTPACTSEQVIKSV